MNYVQVSGKITKPQLLLLEKLYKKTCKILNRPIEILSLSIIDEKEMAKLNYRFFGIKKPTDVLSFEASDEIVICYELAKKQALEERKKIIDEIALLFVHGCLHIAGFDHNNKARAEEMSLLQKKILGQIKNRNLEYR